MKGITQRFQFIGCLFCLAAAILSLLSLIGWTFDVLILTTVRHGLASMKVNTALGLLSLSLSIAFRGRSWRLVPLISGFIGLLTLGEYLFSIDLGIDLGSSASSAAFGRPSIGTAMGLMLLGFSLPMLRSKEYFWQNLAQICIACVTYGSIFIAVGYFHDAAVITRLLPFATMAVHTATALALLGLAIFFTHPEASLMKILTSSTVGGVLCRRALPGAALLPMAFEWLARLGERSGFYGGENTFLIFLQLNIILFAGLIVGSAKLVDQIVRERDRLAAEQTLAMAQFKHLVISIHDYAIMALDVEGRIVSWNLGAEKIFGYTEKEIIGRHFSVFYPEEAIAAGQPTELIREAREKDSVQSQGWHVRKSGERFWATIVLNATRNEQGRLVGFAKITRDVTVWKHAEEVRQETEERLRSVVDNVVDGIISINEDGIINSCNASTEKLFGYAIEELIGHDVSMLMPEPYHSQHGGYIRSYLKTGQRKIIGTGREVLGRRKDGSEFPLELAIGEFRLKGKRFFTGVVRDVTDRKAAELRERDNARRNQEMLENRVAERTHELSKLNSALHLTVAELKSSREELRQLSKRLYAVQEQERSRIAKEVHDELGQMLAVMKIELLRLKNKDSLGPEERANQFRLLMARVDETVGILRRISSDLKPVVLEQLGLASAFEWLVADIGQRTGIACGLKLEADLSDLDPGAATALFRIVQEALTNAIKHAKTDQIDVEVVRRERILSLKVRDYGRGFEVDAMNRTASLGLVGMRERTRDLGGTLHIEQAPSGGTIVKVEVPWPEKEMGVA